LSVCHTLSIVCRREKRDADYHLGDTLLEAARRAGLRPPHSCLAGICGSCIARIVLGSAEMAQNYALTDEEVEAGLVLTCQARPTDVHVSVVYED
jgi:ferredoxin